MKIFGIWLGLIALSALIAPAYGADAGSTADREQILQLERDWVKCWVTLDAAANDRIVADDFLGTEPDGKRVTKADLMAELKSGDAPLASNHLNEDDVRFASMATRRWSTVARAGSLSRTGRAAATYGPTSL